MVESIIKEIDVDPCVEQEMEDLGVLGLFDLSGVSFLCNQFFFMVYLISLRLVPFSTTGVHEGAPR